MPNIIDDFYEAKELLEKFRTQGTYAGFAKDVGDQNRFADIIGGSKSGHFKRAWGMLAGRDRDTFIWAVTVACDFNTAIAVIKETFSAEAVMQLRGDLCDVEDDLREMTSERDKIARKRDELAKRFAEEQSRTADVTKRLDEALAERDKLRAEIVIGKVSRGEELSKSEIDYLSARLHQ